MPVTLRGTSTPARQRLSEHWSPTNGYSAEYEYKGFNEAQMRSKAAQWQNAGIEHDLVNTLGVYTLRGTDTSGQATIDTWEVGINKMSPPALENPVTYAGILAGTGYTIKHLEALQNYIKNGGDLAATKTVLGSNAPALRCLDRLAKGQDAYVASGYTLRHTTNVQNRYGSNISDTNIDRNYATPQLLTEVQNGNSWIFPLPGRLAYKIQQLSAQLIAAYGTKSYYTWGWLKSGSPETTAADNRVNIVTEYTFDQWSEDIYLLV